MHISPLRPFLLALPVATALASPALASSSDAWAEFKADVEAKCVAALPETLKNQTVFVDETGTEAYGVALIAGRSESEKARVTFACVYDKQAKTAQLTGPIGREFVRVITDKQRAAMEERRKKNGAADDDNGAE
ncbi:hypothetical protein GGQ64_001236 [Rhizobium azooxidifex]|uniref:Uncharacterized protein n=1 Tax=Mycoplana azooxidifex TaxID=1636188 RepID=A0A7W6DBU0_9HYPH|nr:hypothetical protein [Mycoplana azooxidifex]MBB3976049.1 hypothetical protein [Mycoplana azooxidifex]